MSLRTAFLWVWIAIAAAVHAEADDADALARVKAHGSIEIAVYDKFPPYSFKRADGTAAGIDVDLANAIASKLGLRARLRFVIADEQVGDDLRNHLWKGHYLGGGVADVMLHVPTDPGFRQAQEQVAIFGSYFHESVAIGYPADRKLAGDSPLLLSGRRIGVELDTIGDHYLSTAYNGRLRTAAVRKLSLSEAVEALRANEVDAVMGPRGELQGLFAIAGLHDMGYRAPRLNGLFAGEWDIGLAVRRSDGGALQVALSQALQDLRNEGTLAAILAAHGIE